MNEQTAPMGHNNPPKAVADMTRDEAIMAWDEAKKTLDRAKAREMELRKHIVAGQFDVDKIGTQNVELGNGWKLKAVVKETFTLSSDVDAVEAMLDGLEDWQADRLVKWSPRLMKKEYDELDAEDRAKVDKVLTIKPASPTLELVAPKGT
jgi:hypothetical protein